MPATDNRPPFLTILLDTVRRDRFVQLMLATVAAAVVVPLFTVDPSRKELIMTGFFQPLMITLVIAAILAGRRRLAHREQRRFLLLFACAFSTWLISAVAGLTVPWDQTVSVLYPLQDSLLAAFYLFMFLASGTHPEWQSGWSHESTGRRLEVTATAVFLSAMLLYFIVLPSQSHPDEYTSLLPSYLLIFFLNVGLIWRFALLRLHSRSAQWKLVYGLVSLVALLWLFVDSAEGLMELELIPYLPQGHPLDIFWHTPYIVLVLAARVQHHPLWQPRATRPHGARREVQTGFSNLSAPIIVYALVIPSIHFLLSAVGVLDSKLDVLRELVVFATLLILGGLALVQHRVLLTEARALQAESLDSERRLQETARLESIGKLAAGIAHDFNNLLLVILGHTTMAMDDLPEGSSSRDRLGEVKRAAERTADVTRRLLAFSRKQALEPREVDLNTVVDEVLQLTNRIIGRNIEVTAELEPGLEPVFLDPAQFEQVLVNMIVNARDAMNEGGKLSIRTSALSHMEFDRDDSVSYSGPGVELAIEDTGIGIPADLRSRIFEPFFTTKGPGEGTGLGLATSYGTICQSGGDLRVESEEGVGTTFRILLPTGLTENLV